MKISQRRSYGQGRPRYILEVIPICSLDPDVDCGSGIQIWIGFVLANVHILRVLFIINIIHEFHGNTSLETKLITVVIIIIIRNDELRKTHPNFSAYLTIISRMLSLYEASMDENFCVHWTSGNLWGHTSHRWYDDHDGLFSSLNMYHQTM